MKLSRTEPGTEIKNPTEGKTERRPEEGRLKGWFVRLRDSFDKKYLPKQDTHLDKDDGFQRPAGAPNSGVQSTSVPNMIKPQPDKLRKLATRQTITAEHSVLSGVYMDAQKQISVIPTPSGVNPGVSQRFDTDKTRNGNLFLEVELPDQTMKARDEVLPSLIETVSQLAPKDTNKDKLLLRLTELCSQQPFNPLSYIIMNHGLVNLDGDSLSLLSDTLIRTCKLRYSPETKEVHADLELKTDQIKFLPLTASEPTLRDCNIKASISVSFPIDDPDKCQVHPAKLEIHVPPQATPLGPTRAG
ncbi:hypothetical protein EOPP23_03660 [Endozoicomonas sp. OPT23]|uniref:hypothetical protein n=1 Tax=Endozoicomonas sp. OPT23 TaxID=2072845 RepID=UPI00129A3D60|nr:hypothetical protein [Endozoicomonas sp. OPT23]MRI32097.1 hypothetical protein [Endozoicomonas sp. OPT23]